MGVEVIGISFDATAKNQQFAEVNNFQYELWSDVDKTLALYYGAAASAGQVAAARVTRILDATGQVVLEYNGVNAGTNPQEVLEDCQVLFGAK